MRAAYAALLLLLAGCAGPADDDSPEPTPAAPTTWTLTYASPPVAVDHNVTFTLQIAGPAGTSDHIGGHYWAESHVAAADATAAFSAGKACVHVAGGGTFPATFAVTCATGPGDHYVRGHLRITAADGTKTEHWAPEVLVAVA